MTVIDSYDIVRMMSLSSFSEKYFSQKKAWRSLLLLGFIVISLPLVIVLVLQQQDLRQRADASSAVVFLDGNNNEITQTDSAQVKVKLTSPWGTKPLSMATLDTAVLGQETAIYQTQVSSDDVNEINGKIDSAYGISSQSMWIGNGQSKNSYTGLRFSSVAIPKNARIISAQVQVRPTSEAWIGLKMQIYGDATGDSAAFSSSSLPSTRTMTSKKVSYSSNTKWVTGRWYMLSDISPVIQEIVSRGDWNTGNSLSIILKGTGANYQRKFVYSVDGNPQFAPRLSVVYETDSPAPTTTVAPTNTPSATATPTSKPTNTPVPPTASPTPISYTDSITLAEDAAFTQNMKQISSVTENPLFTDYIFSNATSGQKTLYVKFHSTTGEDRVYNAGIVLLAPTPTTSMGGHMEGESMAMMAWRVGGKNSPNPTYDTCDDGTDIVAAHNQYYVIAYDGLKYPTWHPAVVTNPITGVGKCYFGHEHGMNPQNYLYWDEIVQHFGKDVDGDGKITALQIDTTTGKLTPSADRAGLPFGIANEHMDMYYNQEGRDSVFVRHEDHVGHKIEFVNKETDINTSVDGNITKSTHEMAQLIGTKGLNVPYYSQGAADQETYKPTGVVCTHLHKFHQGTHSGDAVLNNLHEVIFHSKCESVNVNNINAPALYPNNEVILTGMMSFGEPGKYKQFCFAKRDQEMCGLTGQPSSSGACTLTDPLLSKLPNAIHSGSLGRNMVDKNCLDNWTTYNPGNNYFGPYEIWEGDFAIYKTNTLSDSTRIAEHGRQWDVLDPIRFVDIGYQHPTRSWQKNYQFNSENCKKPGGAFDQLTFVGGCADRNTNIPYDSPKSGFKGLKRTTYFGRNHISNQGGSEIYWTDPIGGNAATAQFTSGLKQKVSTVSADIQSVQSRIQQLYGNNNFLNDRAIQRTFNDGGGTVHAPN